MNFRNAAAILLLCASLPIEALALTTTVNSNAVVIPRISARAYDIGGGIKYTQDDSGKGTTSPLGFAISKHKVTPREGSTAVLGVQIPVNATIVQVRGLMRNEPWGGAQHPPKKNTDELGSVDYKTCPLGHGDCSIAWSDVSAYKDTTTADGKRVITAVFRNWAGRNDRTGTLEVTYSVPDQ